MVTATEEVTIVAINVTQIVFAVVIVMLATDYWLSGTPGPFP